MRLLQVIGFLLMVLGAPAWAQTLSVSGRGEVSVAPDIAHISLGALAEAGTAEAALSDLSKDLTQVLSTLERLGLPSEDVQTTSVRLDVRRDYNSVTGRSRIVGYAASSSIRITVRELTELGTILDEVVTAGASEMNGLQFDIAERAPHLDAARRAAVMDAKHKADVLAEAAGVTLGQVMELAEGGVRPAPMMMEASLARDAGVPIAPGEIDISASVTIRYAIE